jgi:hypothetical protein
MSAVATAPSFNAQVELLRKQLASRLAEAGSYPRGGRRRWKRCDE